MKYIVKSNEPPKLTLVESNEVNSILQNVYIILNSYKGTVPMYRDFGINAAYKDMPMSVAKALLVADITEVIEKFEPRVKTATVIFTADDAETLVAQVEVTV